jgi:hypothetical protein
VENSLQKRQESSKLALARSMYWIGNSKFGAHQMGDWLVAQDGDTLCQIASERGLADCNVLRNHAANAKIKDSQLKLGDLVYVPDLAERQDSVPTDATHVFVRKPDVIAAIRFVHGASGTAFRDDIDLGFLDISNYRTDRAGADGTDALAGPDHWQFDAASDKDPDVFKVEVLDTRTGNAQLDVTLQAMHPIYVFGLAIGTDLNWSSAAERDKRKLEIKVHRASPKPDQRFRSAYLRLVVDEVDQAGRKKQTLLVTDDQPHEEEVEILDQEVSATYKIDTCPRAGTDAQCRVTKQIPVGHNKRRIRCCVGIIRRNVGDATGWHGITEAHIRHRLFHWFRRVYAQANMSPVLVDPFIRLLDPPELNLLSISNGTGIRASGRTLGGGSPSRLSFTITTSRGGVAAKPVALDIPLPPTPAARPTPKALADLLVPLISDGDFDAQAFENSPLIGLLPTRRSADILVRDKMGGRVTITAVRSTDGAATLRLAQASLNNFNDFGATDSWAGTLDERQIIRNFDSGDDRLDCYVVGALKSGARGESFPFGYALDPRFRSNVAGSSPVPFSCIMGAVSHSPAEFGLPVMNGGNSLPYTFPHEAGHSLLDCNHATRRSELMASGTSQAPGLRATKRICDRPVRVAYELFKFSGDTRNTPILAAARLDDSASGVLGGADDISSQIFDPWD